MNAELATRNAELQFTLDGTDKASRLLRVWQCFSDGRVHRTRVIASILRVSPKTVQRDIELLRDAGCDFASNRRGMSTPGLRLVKIQCPCCRKIMAPL